MHRRRGWLCIGMAFAIGCGRVGYEPVADPGADAACVTRGRQLVVNGGFEQPVIGDGTGAFLFRPAAEVPGWETTNPGDWIELWETGHMGVESAGGAQHIELNSDIAADVFQDLSTVPGTALVWAFRHRGRQGEETAEVRVGVPGGALVSQGVFTTDIGAWARYEGTYTVPAGQTLTRWAVTAVSPADGEGNLVDEVEVFECPTD